MLKLKLLENNFFLFIFLFTSFAVFSQNNISGTILSVKNEKLAFANVTVFDENGKSLKTYAISDENGKYNLDLPEGVYYFKVNYLGYKPVSLKKQITKDEILNFILEEDQKALDEVVIKAKSLEANIRNDTIKYNIKQIKTGKERNLKDILEKLPGIDTDGNGKIIANGKKIDKLLIDGKDFFGDQHQLATENISAEMVEGISLLTNYKDISDLDNQDKSEKTAMNIEIGEKYKGRLHGNISIAGGFVQKYEAKTNLFSFSKKTNLYVIASSNNLGNQTFTIEDYINFMGIEKFISDNSGSMDISEDDFLYYLIPDLHVKRKDEQLAAFNLSFNPSKKFKLNTYVVLAKNKVTEEQTARQSYITNAQNVKVNAENTSDNSLLINNSYINLVYKPTNKSVLDYTLSFSPQRHLLNSLDKWAVNSYDTYKNNQNYALNQVLSYKQRMGEYLMLTKLYHRIKHKNNYLKINSSDGFLGLSFRDDNYMISQDIKHKKTDWGIHSAISRKIYRNLSAKINYKLYNSKEIFKSEVYNTLLNNDSNLNILENVLGFTFYNKRKVLVNYNLGLNYSWLILNGKRNYNLLPSAKLSLNFKTWHYLSLSYRRTMKWPQANNLVENSYIISFNALANNQNILATTLSKDDNFDLTYHISDLFSGTAFTINASLSLAHNIMTTNTRTYSDYRINRFYVGGDDKSYNTYFNFRKKFYKIPFIFKLKSLFSVAQQNSYINDEADQINSKSLSNNIKLSSRFKKSFFDFEIGYKRKDRVIESEKNILKNSLIVKKPYLNLFFDYKKWSFTIKSTLVSYKSNTFKREFFEIDPVINYKTKKWIFYIKGNDILNLNRNFIIENAYYDNYFEERTVATLGGYVLAGFQYNF